MKYRIIAFILALMTLLALSNKNYYEDSDIKDICQELQGEIVPLEHVEKSTICGKTICCVVVSE